MTEPGNERFSEADLGPSDDERDATRRGVAERIATTLATSAAGIWVGGMIALGVCAAPFVFSRTPAPYSGYAMGAAFARFDKIAIVASIVILGCEAIRTWAGRGRERRIAPRLRRGIAIALAVCAAYIGMALTPTINEMHAAGVSRNVGPDGEELERVHKQAELVGKAEVGLGLVLIALHIFTMPKRRPEEDDIDDVAPLPPGPRSG